MARSCLSVVLAAGEGTRMRSSRPKVLHSVAGLSMLSHVLQSAARAGAGTTAVVVGAQADAVAAEASRFDPSISVFTQEPRLGTAHAVLSAEKAISEGYDDVLVLFGDTPLVTPDSLLRLREALADGADVAVMGFRTDRPEGYGRVIERDGVVEAIREHRDASAEELAINFCNGGIMGISGKRILADLKAIGNDNAKGEFYLTDIVAVARQRGGKVVAVEAEETEVLGVNDPVQLAAVEAIWQARRRRELMLGGVVMQAPETVFLSHDTLIGEETEIEPNVVFGPGVELAPGTHIRAFSHLEGCRVSTGAVVGPYARLRPGTSLADDVKVGNFCELKNAEIGQGAKINHLSYVGDASVGAGANLGAGTITCNYDGQAKHHTRIGKSAFIGSNSALVAPVTIGEGAYVASGSVVVEDVPDDALALARGRQVNKDGYARRFRKKTGPKH